MNALSSLDAAHEPVPEPRPLEKLARTLHEAERDHRFHGHLRGLAEDGWTIEMGRKAFDDLRVDAHRNLMSAGGDRLLALRTDFGRAAIFGWTGPDDDRHTLYGFPYKVSADMPLEQWVLVKHHPPRAQPNGHEEYTYTIAARGVIEA